MSGYRPGHEEGQNTYINYGAPADSHPEERIFTHPQVIQHGGESQSINPHHGGHIPSHNQHLHPNPPQLQYSPHHIFTGVPRMSNQHQPPPHYGGRQDMGHPSSSVHQPHQSHQSQQHATGTKRPRTDDMGRELGMGGLPEQHMHHGEMQMGGPSMIQHQSMNPYGHGHGHGLAQQQPAPYHSHQIPITIDGTGKRFRADGESSQMSIGAPSMVGMEGMPEPAAKPRGPKLKFTAEDDTLLVDLKENKSLTWKQIAEFFPGRSSGTLQVRYCTKLKAKTTQWTDETIQKLQTALHEYEQDKWRIVAQKVGTGFTSTACKDKAEELAGGGGGLGEGDGDGDDDGDGDGDV